MSREEIKIGDRVRLIHSDNKFTLLKPGDLGTLWNITTFSLMDEQKIRQVWIGGIWLNFQMNLHPMAIKNHVRFSDMAIIAFKDFFNRQKEPN